MRRLILAAAAVLAIATGASAQICRDTSGKIITCPSRADLTPPLTRPDCPQGSSWGDVGASNPDAGASSPSGGAARDHCGPPPNQAGAGDQGGPPYNQAGALQSTSGSQTSGGSPGVGSGVQAGATTSPTQQFNSPPRGATAWCWDGTYSYSNTRADMCAGHGGVRAYFGGW